MTMLLPYSEAAPLIKEGDVLLFRGKGIVSWLIKRYGSGTHSHAGMAHWDGPHLQCVEFREFKGGRSVSLKSQVDSHPDTIDVFRPLDSLSFSSRGTDVVTKSFNSQVAVATTSTMIDLTGLPYGWKNFWKLLKHYIPFVRLAKQNMKDKDPMNVFVCSTAVAFAFRKNYVDPVPYLADSSVMPADLARSALFSYQFTLQKD